ncbi:uncharacterized protein B0T23DRAFT_398219 [Neurospora hispaniola]|uniref:Uncharacterized protein n=1 Tax=Neurospora hispaniola TaxID=588809 RepID=A0AAJ0I1S3_9PEZI|nr:hypothetical protein B0T23DRAFT_398219 [Neurospora hispaniola]
MARNLSDGTRDPLRRKVESSWKFVCILWRATLATTTVAKTLMGLLLENSFSIKTDFKNSSVTCPLCQTDDTADLKARSKVWPTRAKLEVHMKTEYTGEAVWKRKWGQKQNGVFVDNGRILPAGFQLNGYDEGHEALIIGRNFCHELMPINALGQWPRPERPQGNDNQHRARQHQLRHHHEQPVTPPTPQWAVDPINDFDLSKCTITIDSFATNMAMGFSSTDY